ncbi:MAG: hypothetical protein Ta2F_17130 [Termitinemataceae bacterium]|nr:MAG: hypothetical protein Ta2F_17130 [Termitinemataceae bacterium]
MTIDEIKNIIRKDVPIYYRRVYTGIVVLEFAGRKQDITADWTIETSPFGTKETTVNIIDKVDYPLVPLIKDIKKFIDELDENGKMPPL